MEFDEHGKVIKRKNPSNDLGLRDTIVVDREAAGGEPQTLFDAAPARKPKKTAARGRRSKKKKHP